MGRSGRFVDVMMMSGGRGLARHGCGLENDRNVGDFKLYRRRWLLISTKRPSKRRSGAQPSFLRSKTRVNSLFRSVLRLIRSLEASKRLSALHSELTLVFERKNDG